MKSLSTLKYRVVGTYLYSSLMPYEMMISGSSAMTALAAVFMRSSARRSFGFSNAYLFENLLTSQYLSNAGSSGRKSERKRILMKSSTVDAYHDPGVWE